MPLTLPNLDDRSYADLIEEARKLIPAFAPEWSNHNPSDPGITLIEMFAYLSEMLIYRLNRVPDSHVEMFLKLINGPDWKPDTTAGRTLDDEIRDSVLALRKQTRAITAEDYETLAIEACPGQVSRAHCVAGYNLELSTIRDEKRLDHISVVIVPKPPANAPDDFKLSPTLIQCIKDYLEPKRLLTTRLHVVAPNFVEIPLRLRLVPRADVEKEKLRKVAEEKLKQNFHVLNGGLDGNGWPFGRSVYLSEIYQLLDELPEVDYVTKPLTGDEMPGLGANRRITGERKNDKGETEQVLVGAYLWANELVAIQPQLELG